MKNKTGLPLSLEKCFLQTLILLGFAEEQLPDLMPLDDPDFFFTEIYRLLKEFSETKKIVIVDKEPINECS